MIQTETIDRDALIRRGFLAVGWSAYCNNIDKMMMAACLIVASGLLVLWRDSDTGAGIAELALYLWIAMVVQRSVLRADGGATGPSFFRSGNKPFGKYFLKGFILYYPPLLVSPFVYFFIFGLPENVLQYVALVGFGLLLQLLVLALFGLMLPATVAESDASFALAFKRGRSQFAYLSSAMLVGPFVLNILVTIATFGLVLAGLDTGILSEQLDFSPWGTLVALVSSLLSLLANALLATILALAYLRAGGMIEFDTERIAPTRSRPGGRWWP